MAIQVLLDVTLVVRQWLTARYVPEERHMPYRRRAVVLICIERRAGIAQSV